MYVRPDDHMRTFTDIGRGEAIQIEKVVIKHLIEHFPIDISSIGSLLQH